MIGWWMVVITSIIHHLSTIINDGHPCPVSVALLLTLMADDWLVDGGHNVDHPSSINYHQ
jgi:hypothetical protein